MRVLGLSVIPGSGKPRVVGVVLSGTIANPVVDAEFELRASSVDPAEQAVDLARLLSGKLPSLAFEKAVFRVAGTAPVARRSKAQFSRAHAEGASLFVVREHLGQPVVLGDAQAFVRGLTKGGLENAVEYAKSLAAGKYEAVLAALSELT
jgi:hypothetical protein